MKATIIGTGSYIPEYILTNQELSTMVETDDEWIVTRTGISERRIQKSGDVADMAVNAALKALDNAGINSEDIYLIIAATSTPDYLFPNCSSIIQKNTGAINAVCFDISAACSGFIMALSAAKAYIEAGMYKKVLIVCSEKMSGITDWKDRSTCILFGDGAGACVPVHQGAAWRQGQRLFEVYGGCHLQDPDAADARQDRHDVSFRRLALHGGRATTCRERAMLLKDLVRRDGR